MAKKKKPEIWWVVKTGNITLPFTSAVTRRLAIQHMRGYDDYAQSWSDMQRKGYSVVKIQVQELK